MDCFSDEGPGRIRPYCLAETRKGHDPNLTLKLVANYAIRPPRDFAGCQCFAQAHRQFDVGFIGIMVDGIDRLHDEGKFRDKHLLDENGHMASIMGDTEPSSVRSCPLGP